METWHPDPFFYYQPGGGPLFDMGPYYITAMVNLLGGVKSVYGYGHASYAERVITAKEHYGEIIKVNTPTHIESIITLENGKNVSLLTSFDIYSSRQTNIEIYGTKGTLYVPDPNTFGGEVVFYNGEEKQEYRYKSEEHFDYSANSRLLGLADNRFFSILLGRTFDVKDVVCYLVGGLIFFAAEFYARRKSNEY
jgi:predicted dehydrogenase